MRRAALIVSGLGVVLLGGLLALGLAQHPPSDVPAEAGRRVTVDGAPIRYVQTGAGRDVLLVHGSPGTVEDWEPVVARLAAHFRVTAFDRPGHGWSGGADLPHTPAANAAVALGLVRALGLKDVVYVGHSYGGTTGLALAEQAPPEVRAYVLVGSGAYHSAPADRLYRVLAMPVLGRGIAALLAPMVGPSRIEAGVREAFGPNASAMPADFVARRTPWWTRPTVSATLSEERVTLAASLAAQSPGYASIRRPLVLVCGDHDHNRADMERLAREVPGARLVLLPDTGHYVQVARPEAVVTAVEEAAASAGGIS
jgi:pimeloyl-ACP methyl ester carboxylesterase